jgi:adenosylhomocysteine nucleosidase
MLPLPNMTVDVPTDWRCDVGVVFALSTEEAGFQNQLTDVLTIDAHGHTLRLGRCGPHRVTTIVSGPGAEKAAAACEVLFQGHQPRWVISAGFCGALDPRLKVEAVVLADGLFGDSKASAHLEQSLKRIASAALPRPSATGRFVQVDRIVCRAIDKKSLADETGAIACDMESLAVAQACAKRDIPVSAVRGVSDAADEDLPPDLDPLMQAKSAAGTFGAVVGALWRRPSSVKDMLKLKERAILSSEALAQYLVKFVGALPLEPPAGEVATEAKSDSKTTPADKQPPQA